MMKFLQLLWEFHGYIFNGLAYRPGFLHIISAIRMTQSFYWILFSPVSTATKSRQV